MPTLLCWWGSHSTNNGEASFWSVLQSFQPCESSVKNRQFCILAFCITAGDIDSFNQLGFSTPIYWNSSPKNSNVIWLLQNVDEWMTVLKSLGAFFKKKKQPQFSFGKKVIRNLPHFPPRSGPCGRNTCIRPMADMMVFFVVKYMDVS